MNLAEAGDCGRYEPMFLPLSLDIATQLRVSCGVLRRRTLFGRTFRYHFGYHFGSINSGLHPTSIGLQPLSLLLPRFTSDTETALLPVLSISSDSVHGFDGTLADHRGVRCSDRSARETILSSSTVTNHT